MSKLKAIKIASQEMYGVVVMTKEDEKRSFPPRIVVGKTPEEALQIAEELVDTLKIDLNELA